MSAIAPIFERARRRTTIALVIVLAATAALFAGCHAGPVSSEVCPGDGSASTPAWAPSSSQVDAPIDAHPFVGNGYLGLRVPPRGMGYTATNEMTGWPLYTPAYDGAFVAGLYARTPGVADGREVAAAIPNWSALLVGVGEHTYSPTTPSAQITNFAQTLHLRCGLVRTRLTWTTPDGKATDLVYDVLTDRTDQHVGAVHLTVVPHWSGEMVVADVLDGAGARRLRQTDVGARDDDSIRVGFRTDGTDVGGDIVSVLRPGQGVQSNAIQQLPPDRDLSARQEVRFPVRDSDSYQMTKFVGVDTTRTSPDPVATAFDAAQRAVRSGWAALLAGTATAWRSLWRGDIEVPDQPDAQTWARGALYSLYSSTNSLQDNSISPVGLSSDNYGGTVFWDADIWMFPALLQFSPQLAKSVVEYRYRTLPAAQANARRLGYRGAFYPWTSASSGDLDECHSWDPPHCLTQIHLQGDVSLAAWQYYTATGDNDYLRDRGWPIMRGVAEFWASRVTRNDDGSYSIRDVAGPDEYSNGVNDSVYTNAVAALALRNAARAAEILHEQRPPEWTTIADGLRMPFDGAQRIFVQFDGYTGTPIKQADTVLLIYPLDWPMPPDVAAHVLEYYSARTDPDGPAMTDSVHAIDAAKIGMPGCAADTYLERAARPFVRAPFGQFAEARGEKAGAKDPLAGAPAFTFVTAAGGFLQSFTNGLLGLRFDTDGIRIAPTLPPELRQGLTIRGIHWQGRTFDAAIGADETTLTLTDGQPMQVRTDSETRLLTEDATFGTRRPDLTPTDNLARCKPVTTTSDEPGKYADAAVDGSTATGWAPNGPQGALTVDLGKETPIDRIVPHWTEPAPATITFTISADEHTWTPVTVNPATGTLPSAVSARYVRIELTATNPATHPGVRELEISGPRT
ncbi:discoidin domain-containing protein [Nocardia sp. NBC_00565]|uniref:discoidin domain-containing protein n=1 Tax=Nocardia sp. NBC_00565 TaxID=2975993 RepID=UPI002E7FBFFD|nr:discoidin domain-containing protein [Nocardia sp. NBC_00565]WUC06919.1 discoidin domain-containing protein [Nocardia sp. NBC_00565]